MNRPSRRIAPAYTEYDSLSLETALIRAWDDPNLPLLDRSNLRVRVRAQHPALARVLDRFLAVRRGLPDPAPLSRPTAVLTVDFPAAEEVE
jgi:hypothetical protein